MHRYLKVTSVAIGGVMLAGGGALAADLPRRQSAPIVSEAPIAAPPAFTWTGFYAGLNGGYAPGSSDTSGSVRTRNKAQTLIGLQAGYNQQWGSVVAGVEMDLDRANGQARGITSDNEGYKVSNGYLGSVRARLGYAVLDRLLVFGTAGLAASQMSMSMPDLSSRSKTQWHQGYVVGAGAEYALTDNVSVKAEYLYTKFDKKTYFKKGDGQVVTMEPGGSVVRAGVNYKF